MNPARKLITFSLRLYKLFISPALHFVFGPFGGCRFTPTCSVYAAEAVALHGVIRGTVLAVKRLCRCQPWGGSGHDPVPTEFRLFSSCSGKNGAAMCLAGSHVEIQRATHFGCPPPQL